jgi:hypothetical protein
MTWRGERIPRARCGCLVVVLEPGIELGPQTREPLGVAGLAIGRSRPAPASLCLLHQVRARQPRASRPPHSSGTVRIGRQHNSSLFARAVESASLRISTREGLAAEQAPELLGTLLELAHLAGADYHVVGPDRFPATSAIRCLHLNSRFGQMPCLWATNETDMPGSSVSSTSRIFSATDRRRRRCTDVITSTRWPSSRVPPGRQGVLVSRPGCFNNDWQQAKARLLRGT